MFFKKNVLLSAYSLILAFFFACIPNKNTFADWNTGITIEDASIRIAINIVDKGIDVSIDTTDNKQSSLNTLALSLFKIHANNPLIPQIKTNFSEGKKTDPSHVEVFFPFLKAQPKQLDLTPDFNLITSIGKKHIITVSHHGLPVIDHGILTKPERLILNWEDPWYSHFENPELKRDHNDPVMAFLYIEPTHMKSEIVVRIKEMANWTDLGLRDETMIYPDEFTKIKERVGQYLLTQNEVSADSKTLSPTLDKVDFIRMGAADIQAYEPQQAQRQAATIIGVSITYQTEQLANKVQWNWKLFNDKIQRVSIRAYDPAGLFDSYVTPKYPVFEWENMLADVELPEISEQVHAVPVNTTEQSALKQYGWLLGLIGFLFLVVISGRYLPSQFRKTILSFAVLTTLVMGYYLLKTGKISLDGGKRLETQQAKPLLKQLLWNVYQAFEASQEENIYETLAYSVAGDLRETLYLQNRQAFLVEDGGQSKVSSIKINEITPLSSALTNENLFDCEWLVIGDVIHWGHQHRRENFYRAHIKLAPVKGDWKIVELKSLDQQRVDGKK